MSRPADYEVEVTLIGPGYGECVIVHVGDNMWLIVDSCVESGTTGSAALSYLDSIGVSPENITHVVATHWHDDHVRGLASLVVKARNAQFICPAALRSNEFLALLQPPALPSSFFTSGTREMLEVMAELSTSRRRPMFAVSSRRIIDVPSSVVSGIWTLSPSDEEIRLGIQRFAAAYPAAPTGAPGRIRRVAALEPNDCSVVLLVELADGGAFLLGADCEHHRGPSRGWHAILGDPGRPHILSRLYKVAHHGSVTAHCNAMWGSMCDTSGEGVNSVLVANETVCLVAPWRRGSHGLPSDEDTERLRSLGAGVHITATPDQAFGGVDEARRFQGYYAAKHFSTLQNNPGRLTFRYIDGAWRLIEQKHPNRG